MKHGTRVLRRPSRARPPTSRIAAAIIATGALVVLVAACSSPSSAGGSPAAAGSATSSSAVAYSHCMRSRGVPNFPDPPSSGLVPKADAQELGVSGSQLQAAQRACQHLYPTNGRGARCLAPAMRGDRRLSAGHGAAGGERHAAACPVHALPWGAELARPHRRFRGAP